MPNYMTYQQATDLAGKIDEAKQDRLTPGEGIEISDNIISAPGSAGGVWGGITGNLSDQTDLNTALGKKYDTDDTAESTLADNDYMPFYDTSSSRSKKTLWSNIKAVLKAYFDTIYSTFSGAYNDLSGKPSIPDDLNDLSDIALTTPANGDFLGHDGSSWINKKLPIASANTLGGVKVGNNLSIDNDGVLSATGGGGSSAWSNITGKPFSTVNSDDFRTANDTLAMPVPHYYVEVNGDNLSGTYQTESEPIVLPDGCLSKPFELTIRNVGTAKNWQGGRTSASTDWGSRYTYVLYVREQSSNTVYGIPTISPRKTITVENYRLTSNSFLCSLYYRRTTSSTEYLGDSHTFSYYPRLRNANKNAFISTLTAYEPSVGIRRTDDGAVTEAGVDINLCGTYTPARYILFTYEYNASTEAYRGHHAYYITVPNINGEWQTPQAAQMAGSSNSGVTVSYSVENSKPYVNIKASSSTYKVSYLLLEVSSGY